MGWNNRKIPFIGDELAKIGKIYDMAMMPCSPTPEAWVLAFWYGIPRMLWALFKPDPIDDVWERVGRTRGVKRRQKFKFVEEYTEDIELKPSLRWVRFAGDWAQRVGWWMLIVDAAINHAMYWQSAAMAFEGCKSDDAAYAQGEGDDSGSVAPGAWKRLFIAVTDTRIFSGGIGEVFIPAGFGYYASFSVSSKGLHTVPPESQAMITGWRIISGSDVIAQGDVTYSVDGKSNKGSGFVRKPVIGLTSKTLQFQVTSDSAGFWEAHGTINVTGSGIPLGLRQGDP
jgi:hypothetical protein